jgi:hypothetical protein
LTCRHDVGLQPGHASVWAIESEKEMATSLYLNLTTRSLYHSQQHDVARYLTQFSRSSTSISCCIAHNRLWGSGIQIQSLKRVIFKRHLQDVR